MGIDYNCERSECWEEKGSCLLHNFKLKLSYCIDMITSINVEVNHSKKKITWYIKTWLIFTVGLNRSLLLTSWLCYSTNPTFLLNATKVNYRVDTWIANRNTCNALKGDFWRVLYLAQKERWTLLIYELPIRYMYG